MIELILGKYNYWVYITLMMIGFYAMIEKENLIKKIIGMNIFQTAVFLFYISIAKVKGGTAPILWEKEGIPYDNPIPHVLILTAIVVSVSTTAVALALIIRIFKEYGTIEEDKILIMSEVSGKQDSTENSKFLSSTSLLQKGE
ncbi:MAG: cation:proton antiporter subunit C [Nitrospinota bacterium]|jgi:multicomponent Na+:H+ antiporter subunit C|nr:cation:proton antiporter subunit C [Nitrospinota bacterium]MDP7581459.1 cation:proton antiporter subunit C [Nitrospinota bacterium]HJN03264.1 cation:proton antiporter subunit C [Nitrospinota bacterium]|tara:strand:- start:5395 stop:5823 length:429 start_codon:yes stop_codon:yes gene_type:complete